MQLNTQEEFMQFINLYSYELDKFGNNVKIHNNTNITQYHPENAGVWIDFKYVNLNKIILRDIVFSKYIDHIKNFNIDKSFMFNCDFSKVSIESSEITNGLLRNIKFNNTRIFDTIFDNLTISHVAMNNSKIGYCKFTNMKGNRISFVKSCFV